MTSAFVRNPNLLGLRIRRLNPVDYPEPKTGVASRFLARIYNGTNTNTVGLRRTSFHENLSYFISCCTRSISGHPELPSQPLQENNPPKVTRHTSSPLCVPFPTYLRFPFESHILVDSRGRWQSVRYGGLPTAPLALLAPTLAIPTRGCIPRPGLQVRYVPSLVNGD